MSEKSGAVRVWPLLLAGPVLFLLAIVAVSFGLGANGVPADQIGAQVPLYASQILAAVLAVLAVIVAVRLPLVDLWALPRAEKARRDAGIGALVGAAIAVAYFAVLAPLTEVLQANVGDYVPPGAVLDSISGQIGWFFIANVVLAPVVEETIYRGFGLRALIRRHGKAMAVILSCLAFGALHWSGGVWYMVLTGGVAGGAFAALALRRGGLLAPFCAHLTLNLIEFGVAAFR